jgi:hypothetical protein
MNKSSCIIFRDIVEGGLACALKWPDDYNSSVLHFSDLDFYDDNSRVSFYTSELIYDNKSIVPMDKKHFAWLPDSTKNCVRRYFLDYITYELEKNK